ncbi:MAG TPA: DegT/DnrJ/EryC1/StrS family aminotransferase [Candidatus Limnocylindrales bacterium]
MADRLAIFGGSPVVPPGTARTWPQIRDDDRQAVIRVLDRGQLGGPRAPEAVALQEEWAAYCAVRHCLATNSGTAALHLALVAAGVQPGDEVITSAFTFSASAHAILHALAIPVFADIDPVTFTLDPAHVESLVTPRTRAVMPVHIHGMPADLDAMRAICERHGLILIEDACQAHGAEYRGRRVGGFGQSAAFSLNFTKSFPGGEGGLFTTDDDEVLAVADSARVFGEDTGILDEVLIRPYLAYRIGWNYRSQELPAALARAQLRHLDEANERARRNASLLTDGLRGRPGLRPPEVPADRVCTFQKYRVRLLPEELGLQVDPVAFRDRVLVALRAEGVAAALWHTKPIPAYPLFQERVGYGGTRFPWTMPPASRDVTYDVADYPETTRLLDGSVLIGSEPQPLAAQDESLMATWLEAVDKVLASADRLMEVPEAALVR